MGTAVADAGYFSEANSKLDLGVDLLIATTKSHRVGKGVESPEPSPQSPPSLTERTRQRKPVIEAAAGGGLTITEAACRLGLSYPRTAALIADYNRRGEVALEMRRQPNRAGHSPKPPSAATLARRAMQEKLSQPENLERYRKRAWMVEGVFAHTKSHRGYRRFLRRGIVAVDAEWKLIHLAANIRKAHRHANPLLPPGLNPKTRLLSRRQNRLRRHRSGRCRAHKPS